MSSDQHLLPGESFAEYKARVLDTKSASFCGAKWYYATVWLNTGQTTACHHPLPHQVDPIEVQKNPKLLSNTPQKKQERLEMQQGIQCKGCDYCWRVENLNSDAISDRPYKSVLYSDDDLQKAYKSDHNEDFDLRYLEISFDRTCNFACSYCNPAFSTTWAKDIKKFGSYTDIGHNGNDHYGHSHDQANQYDEDNNPYVEAFFKWWHSDLNKTLSHLRLTGGEPLMSKHTWKLLDLMSDEPSAVTYFAINSNLCFKDDLIDKLIAKAKTIKGFNIYSSNEAVGKCSEYIRDGMDWKQWEHNFKKIYDSQVFASMHVMCTISALAMESITEFLDWCLAHKEKYKSADAVTFTLNILRFPDFQSLLVLPQHLREKFAGNLQDWLDNNLEHPYLHEMEINHVKRLIDYCKNENNQMTNKDKLATHFKNYFQQYDQRRGKNLKSCFPQIGAWLDEL